MTFSQFEITGIKHVRRRGKTVEQLPTIDRATETHFKCQAIADVDGHRFGMAVLALQPTETLPAPVIVALQGRCQDWVDANPDGDPGDKPDEVRPR